MAYSATIKSDLTQISEIDKSTTTVKDWVNKINDVIQNLNLLKQNLADDLNAINEAVYNEFTIAKSEHNTDIENISKNILNEEQSLLDFQNKVNDKIDAVNTNLTTNITDTLSSVEKTYVALSDTVNTDLKNINDKVNKIPDTILVDEDNSIYAFNYTDLTKKPIVLTDNFTRESSVSEESSTNVTDSYYYTNPEYDTDASSTSVSQFYPDKIDGTDKDGTKASDKVITNKFTPNCGLMTFDDKIKLSDLVTKYTENKLYEVEQASATSLGGIKVDDSVFSISDDGVLTLNSLPSSVKPKIRKFSEEKTIQLTGDLIGKLTTDFSSTSVNFLTSIATNTNVSVVKDMSIDESGGFIHYNNGFCIQWGEFDGKNAESVYFKKAFLFKPICNLTLNCDVINDIAIDFGTSVSYKATEEKITIYNNLPDKTKNIKVTYVAFGKMSNKDDSASILERAYYWRYIDDTGNFDGYGKIDGVYENVTKIDVHELEYTFAKCTGLTGTISFEKLISVDNYGLYHGFTGCTGITAVEPFSELLTVGISGMANTFSGCTNLNDNISFPKLTNIGEYGLSDIFNGSYNIKSVDIFDELSAIEKYGLYNAFLDCSSISESVGFPKLTIVYDYGMANIFKNCLKISSVEEFTELTNIGEYGLSNAFKDCISLDCDISFPKLTTVSNYGLANAFDGCTSLTKEINFPELVTIGDYGLSNAFNGCTKLACTVNFPKLKTIGENGLSNAFNGCTGGIKEIHFPESLKDNTQCTLENMGLLDITTSIIFDL